MTGLGNVKGALRAMEVVKTNVVLGEDGKPPRDIVLPRYVLGNSGTGEQG